MSDTKAVDSEDRVAKTDPVTKTKNYVESDTPPDSDGGHQYQQAKERKIRQHRDSHNDEDKEHARSDSDIEGNEASIDLYSAEGRVIHVEQEEQKNSDDDSNDHIDVEV